MEEFNSGFTERSYFNIFKEVCGGLCKDENKIDKLEFMYCVDEGINARASYDKTNDHDYLKVNTGTIIKMVACIKTAFSQNNILCNYGNASNEKNDKYIGELQVRNNLYQILFRTKAPIVDPIRERLSDFVSLIAIRFIMAHELGHILNGHTRFLYDMYLNPTIQMREVKQNNNEQYCLDRRTLEMDADGCASTYSIDNILVYFETKDNYDFWYLKNIGEVLELWGFAIASVFLMFESEDSSSYDKKKYYLPNEARYFMAVDAARQTLLSYNRNNVLSSSIDENIFNISVNRGLIEAEKFFNIFFTRSIISNRGKYMSYSKEVSDNWANNIRTRLKPFSRTILFSFEETEKAIRSLKNRAKE